MARVQESTNVVTLSGFKYYHRSIKEALKNGSLDLETASYHYIENSTKEEVIEALSHHTDESYKVVHQSWWDKLLPESRARYKAYMSLDFVPERST